MNRHGSLLNAHGRLLLGCEVGVVEPCHTGLVVYETFGFLPILISRLIIFMIMNSFTGIEVSGLVVAAVMGGVELGIEKV